MRKNEKKPLIRPILVIAIVSLGVIFLINYIQNQHMDDRSVESKQLVHLESKKGISHSFRTYKTTGTVFVPVSDYYAYTHFDGEISVQIKKNKTYRIEGIVQRNKDNGRVFPEGYRVVRLIREGVYSNRDNKIDMSKAKKYIVIGYNTLDDYENNRLGKIQNTKISTYNNYKQINMYLVNESGILYYENGYQKSTLRYSRERINSISSF